MRISDPKAHKDNLKIMLQGAQEQESAYWAQSAGSRISAAPYCFERAAILLRKQREYDREIEICKRWVSIMDDYQDQPMVKAGRASLTHKGPTSLAIAARLTTAEELAKNPPATPPKAKPAKPKPSLEEVTLPPLTGKITGGHPCEFDVVGESHYQPALRKLRNSRHMATDNDFLADIVAEPGNPYDKTACAIYIEGAKVGYLPRSAAADFFQQVSDMGVTGHWRFQTKAKLTGGWGDRPMVGVLLSLPKP
ncbi:HIRAN domain-containing protein [Pseudomonas sp.]|uniref:HIRAN domain-containing protein n=1 Tax=Pseudomonas sp. TaxID=306 RepID=UPI002FC5C9CD